TPPAAPAAVGGATRTTRTSTGASRRPTGSAGAAAAADSHSAADTEAAVAAATAHYEKELEELTTTNEALTNESGELRAMVRGQLTGIGVESLEKERDFYFNKLREIEIMLQGVEDAETNPLAQTIFKVLYATEDDAAEEQVAGEPQDEQM
ncbi:hypothetical protein BBJ28_00008357, partial [Nothophytophthora sp. Chile5]